MGRRPYRGRLVTMNTPTDDADATAKTRAATTCGPLFLRAVRHFTCTADPHNAVLLFSAGHMCGQAEKIYLGACKAAMFCPSPEYHRWAFNAALYLSKVYGLQVSVFDNTEIADEIWLHTAESSSMLGLLSRAEVNTPEWHMW